MKSKEMTIMLKKSNKNTIDKNDPGLRALIEKIECGVAEGMKDYKVGRIYSAEEMEVRLNARYERAKKNIK